VAALPKQECQGLHSVGLADDDQQRVARQLLPRRNTGGLTHDEFEIALDHYEARASLISLAQVSASAPRGAEGAAKGCSSGMAM